MSLDGSSLFCRGTKGFRVLGCGWHYTPLTRTLKAEDAPLPPGLGQVWFVPKGRVGVMGLGEALSYACAWAQAGAWGGVGPKAQPEAKRLCVGTSTLLLRLR